MPSIGVPELIIILVLSVFGLALPVTLGVFVYRAGFSRGYRKAMEDTRRTP